MLDLQTEREAIKTKIETCRHEITLFRVKIEVAQKHTQCSVLGFFSPQGSFYWPLSHFACTLGWIVQGALALLRLGFIQNKI